MNLATGIFPVFSDLPMLISSIAQSAVLNPYLFPYSIGCKKTGALNGNQTADNKKKHWRICPSCGHFLPIPSFSIGKTPKPMFLNRELNFLFKEPRN